VHPRKRPRPSSRRAKKPRLTNPTGPVRRSIWIERQLFAEIEKLAKLEERKSSDMIRVLIRRGLVSRSSVPN
jgi:hypothetical protein